MRMSASQMSAPDVCAGITDLCLPAPGNVALPNWGKPQTNYWTGPLCLLCMYCGGTEDAVF